MTCHIQFSWEAKVCSLSYIDSVKRICNTNCACFTPQYVTLMSSKINDWIRNFSLCDCLCVCPPKAGDILSQPADDGTRIQTRTYIATAFVFIMSELSTRHWPYLTRWFSLGNRVSCNSCVCVSEYALNKVKI